MKCKDTDYAIKIVLNQINDLEDLLFDVCDQGWDTEFEKVIKRLDILRRSVPRLKFKLIE